MESLECRRAQSLIRQALSVIDAGDKVAARRYLEQVRETRCVEQVVVAHRLLFRIAETPEEKRQHLESALAADPTDAEARRELAILDGRLKREDIINPDALPSATAREPGAVGAKKFVCTQCGAAVAFDAGQKRLACAYCGHQLTVLSALQDAPLPEQDFFVALAQEGGHHLPPGLHTFQCQGCQATILASQTLSSTCPYCASSHVIALESRTFIPPQGIIPFEVPELRAREIISKWVRKNAPEKVKLTRPKGVYLPIWTFELTGEIAWTGMIKSGGNNSRKQSVSGAHSIFAVDQIVPATHTLPYTLNKAFSKFLLNEVVPYDPAYLVNWHTALYDVPVADASLVARQTCINDSKRVARVRAEAAYGTIENFQARPKNVSVPSFKSILLPLWVSRYRYEKQIYTVVVNGQIAKPLGEKPETRFQKFLNRLLD